MNRRDQRDPQLLGETYLKLRAKGVDIDTAVQMPVAPYENGKWMSSNPEHHHMAEFFTNLPEDAGDLSDGA